MPRRGLNVSDCEIARAFKVSGSGVDPISFIVPRKVRCRPSSIFASQQLTAVLLYRATPSKATSTHLLLPQSLP